MIKAFIVGLLFWSVLVVAWASNADELPAKPRGHTIETAKGLEECFPTGEFRKIALWVELGEHLHKKTESLNELIETTNAELTVVSQEAAARTAQLRATEEEIARLRIIILQQQDDYDQHNRQHKLRKGLAWGGTLLLAAVALTFGVAWGVSK